MPDEGQPIAYEVLEPKMDAVYKEEQDRENAKKPH